MRSPDSSIDPRVYPRLAEDWRRNGVVWWPLDPYYINDPYPHLRRLREAAPCYHSSLTGEYLVTCYREVERILRDFKGFNGKGPNPDTRHKRKGLIMVGDDPPNHTRLRRLASQAVTPVHMDQMEDYARATAHWLLDQVADQDVFDWMSVLAKPLPILVVGRMVGWPEEDMETLVNRSAVANYGIGVEPYVLNQRWIRNSACLNEQRQWVRANMRFLRRLVRLVEERRSDPQDDVVSRIVEGQHRDDGPTQSETVDMLRLLLLAGNSSVSNQLGNGLLALLRYPEQMQLLRERPDLIADAVEEFMRYDSSVQLNHRNVVEDTEIAGMPVPAGSSLKLLIGAANRDPEQYERPDELDFTRPNKRHLTFGRGIHHCLGARLARLEARVAFEVLLERFAEVQLSGDPLPAFARMVVKRGPEHLRVRVRKSVT